MTVTGRQVEPAFAPARDAGVTLLFGDGEHLFRLRLGELRKLEEARRAGCMEILKRLHESRWFADDVVDVLRWGLIGGGKTPEETARLISLYVEPAPLGGHVLIATAVLAAVLVGVPDDPIPEPEASQGNLQAPAATTGAEPPALP